MYKANEKKDNKFCGKAFIIFNNQNVATKINDKLHVSPARRILKYIWSKITFWRPKRADKSFPFRTKKAGEPTDIFWENLPITTATRFKRSMVSFLLMGCLLVFSF
mmetsp:Transcript_11745/g.11692  ORF Transcript_11745/g.11692 Transcript_11745/m.11692 type:complete len:106 (-) Transcript_11745:331-648(-)